MKYKLSSTIAVLILAILVLLIYEPLLENAPSVSMPSHAHQMDSMQPGIEGTLTFCSAVWPPYVNAQGSERAGYVVDLLRDNPEIDLPIAGARGWMLQGEEQQVVFIEFDSPGFSPAGIFVRCH